MMHLFRCAVLASLLSSAWSAPQRIQESGDPSKEPNTEVAKDAGDVSLGSMLKIALVVAGLGGGFYLIKKGSGPPEDLPKLYEKQTPRQRRAHQKRMARLLAKKRENPMSYELCIAEKYWPLEGDQFPNHTEEDHERWKRECEEKHGDEIARHNWNRMTIAQREKIRQRTMEQLMAELGMSEEKAKRFVDQRFPLRGPLPLPRDDATTTSNNANLFEKVKNFRPGDALKNFRPGDVFKSMTDALFRQAPPARARPGVEPGLRRPQFSHPR